VLPAERRVRRREDFSATVRDGARIGAPALVIHVRTGASEHPARAGFIVGRAVGPAVRRNRVRRRLRHLIASRLAEFPAGTEVIVRATPAAASATGRELAATLNRLLDRVRLEPAATTS
jgi:ribonuclease P protein component